MKLTTIILTYNEEIHIERAINSVSHISNRIMVIDSGSNDATTKIAANLGAEVLFNPFTTQANQFNWALDQLSKDNTEWVFRLDADEVVSSALSCSILDFLKDEGTAFNGAAVNRNMKFLNKTIKYGGLFPIQIIRLFRFGFGRSENRWMDEHIIVDGKIKNLDGELLDHNKKSLTWWIDKHNHYASREVLGKESLVGPTSFKRSVKQKVYSRMPIGIRSFIYFIYRFVIRLGFLDSKEGVIFHLLQGFWYRYLVDVKLHEVRSYQKLYGVDCKEAVSKVLEIDI
jgi:glycosyltransferase involved in cell wall biosynthesis